MLWVIAFALLLAMHGAYLTLPYYWDELGQFVPQTLDLYNEGRWIPIHTLPNVHPPGLEALLAMAWIVARGPSIVVARVLMLAIAAFGVVGAFLLAIRLSRRAPGAPAFAALLLLLASPLFYTQSMMVQLDMPAMVFSIWALLEFLEGRLRQSVLFALAAVLMKETAVVLPVVLAGWLVVREKRVRDAAWFLIPGAALSLWILFLWHATGHLFGDPEFSQYNTWYSLQPVRLGAAIIRRLFYLFFAEFRWIGTAALVWFWKRQLGLKSPEWAVVALFAAAHILAVSAFGGAVLERYLLPVLPILFAAFAIAWMSFEGRLRLIIPAAAMLGSLLSMVWYPPYPFPFEDNLAMADFVAVQKLAADYVANEPEIHTVATAWPLTDALRRPEFGYITRPVNAIELHDFRATNLQYARNRDIDALIVYTREWEPRFSLRSYQPVRRFLERYYDYAPRATAAEIDAALDLRQVIQWGYRGMTVEIYRPRKGKEATVLVQAAPLPQGH